MRVYYSIKKQKRSLTKKMKKLLEIKINECRYIEDFFHSILKNDCEELREAVRQDLGYEKFEDIDKNILFADDARNIYWKLNQGYSKTRNWLIIHNEKN